MRARVGDDSAWAWREGSRPRSRPAMARRDLSSDSPRRVRDRGMTLARHGARVCQGYRTTCHRKKEILVMRKSAESAEFSAESPWRRFLARQCELHSARIAVQCAASSLLPPPGGVTKHTRRCGGGGGGAAAAAEAAAGSRKQEASAARGGGSSRISGGGGGGGGRGGEGTRGGATGGGGGRGGGDRAPHC